MKENLAELKKFFSKQTCLIVEPSAPFLESIKACITSLELPETEVITVKKYEEAVKVIQELKPKILICEYDVGGKMGLSLVDMQQKFFDERARITIIVSRNSSDSVVAEAAEEQVDAFLLKPFSPETFRAKLVGVIEKKINPSPYTLKLQEGYELVAANNLSKALDAFTEAKKLNEKPCGACFGAGKIHQQMGDLTRALESYREGRKYQNLHYQCLSGEFNVLIAQREFEKAYELVPTFTKNFPLSPQRLSHIFLAAVFATRFENLLIHYQQFTFLDNRSPDLVKVVTSALISGGKWYLSKGDRNMAKEYFEKAVGAAGREFSYVEQVVNNFLKVNAIREADEFIGKVLPTDHHLPAFSRLKFKVGRHLLGSGDILKAAKAFFESGHADAETYVALVQVYVDNGRGTLAETVIAQAVKQFPDLRNKLYQIFSTLPPKQSKGG